MRHVLMRHVPGLIVIFAALALRVQAAPGDSLCTLAIEPAQTIAACTALIGEPDLRGSVRAKGYSLRGWARLRSSDAAGAQTDFDAALGLDADNVSALLGRAMIAGSDNHADAALAAFAQVEKLEPNNTGLHADRAQFFINQRRYGDALADAQFQRYGPGASQTFLGLRCRARAYGGIDLEMALQACTQALWLQPRAPVLIEALGIVALKQKHFAAALSDFGRLSALEPNAARGWYGKGLAEAALGQDAEAKADIAKAQRINADVTRIFDGFGVPPV